MIVRNSKTKERVDVVTCSVEDLTVGDEFIKVRTRTGWLCARLADNRGERIGNRYQINGLDMSSLIVTMTADGPQYDADTRRRNDHASTAREALYQGRASMTVYGGQC